MKKITLFFLLCLAAVGASATEWSGSCGAQVTWSLSTADSTLRLYGSGPMTDYNTDTRPPWYPYRHYIAHMTMTPAITTVGTYAFADLNVMRSAVIADSVWIVKEWSFYYCTRLPEITIPNRTETIEQYGFAYCYQLSHCTLGNRLRLIDRYAFRSTLLTYVHFPNSLERINAYAFSYTQPDTIAIPASVQYIDRSVWWYCSNIDTIWVEAGNSHYDSRNGCSAINETASNVLFQGSNTGTVPDGIVEVSSQAFANMTLNTRITLPNSAVTFRTDAFQNVPKTLYNDHTFAHLPESFSGTYTIPAGITTIATSAFNMNNLSGVTIPATVTRIEDYAFQSCNFLRTVSLPESLVHIGQGAFSGCGILQSIVIPTRIRELYSYTFRYCYALESVTFPDSLQKINYSCFSSCTSLQSVTIPDAVRYIDGYAFSSCKRLKTITIPCNLTTLYETVFNYCDSIYSIIWNVRTIRDFTNGPFFDIASHITDFTFGDSVRYVPSNLCANMVNLRTLSVGRQVEQIAPYAFDGCTGLRHVTWAAAHCADFDIYDYAPFYSARDSITRITLTETVDTIPSYLCMDMTGIRTLHLPASVHHIGPFAFRGCYNLDTITVAAGNTVYDSRGDCNALCHTATNTLLVGCNRTVIPSSILHIGESAFRRCIRLQHIDLPPVLQTIGREAFQACEALRKVTLPIGVRDIADYTFTACTALDTLICGDSLRTIGIRALAGCEALKHVYLPAAIAKMDLYAFSACSSLTRLDLTNPVPPVVFGTTFENTTCTFYTPCAYLADYREADDWQPYRERLLSSDSYTLELAVNDLSLGMASIVQSPECLVDAIVEAEAGENAEFVEWQDEQKRRVSTDNPYQFPLDRDRLLTAVFRPVENPEEGLTEVLTEGTPVAIYTLTGTKVFEGRLPASQTLRELLPQGIYVMRSETLSQKVQL